MTKQDKIFRVIAIAGFGLGVYAAIRTNVVISAFQDMKSSFDQMAVDFRFVDIVDRYDDEGEN